MAQWASWHVSLSIPENRTQKYPKLTSLWHFEVDIPENFQKLNFYFLNFLEILFSKHVHFMAQWASLNVSLSITKNRPQKYPKLKFSIAFWNWHSWKFLKMKVFVFFSFLEFFPRLMPEFLRSPHICCLHSQLFISITSPGVCGQRGIHLGSREMRKLIFKNETDGD